MKGIRPKRRKNI
ncbi:hypothetical protein MTR67_002556 [Solanum verrucosum]|uniref:Uncharacterized protein n=1 Tax=Solanum verrucosum TaxID=315347 RepID=A0AAF0T8I8_SOLVR|nr:hypothetical protein MTR67_002556 [Solanum verrucosum]